MRTSAKPVWIVIVVVVIAWLGYVLWSTPSFQECVAAKQRAKAANETPKNPPEFLHSSIVRARIDSACAFGVLYEFRDASTAIATVFIAIFTFTLWRSTDKMWKEARESRTFTLLSINAAAASANAANRLAKATERQLRAYLSVSTGEVIFQNDLIDQPFVILPDCVNVGQTPASETSYTMLAAVLPYPLPDDFRFDHVKESVVTSAAVVMPRGKYRFGAALDRLLTPDEINRITFGKNERLYGIGTVRYKDAFGEKRHTNFCQSYTWKKDGTPLGENTKHHNDAS